MVTHNPDLSMYATKVLTMVKGKINEGFETTCRSPDRAVPSDASVRDAVEPARSAIGKG